MLTFRWVSPGVGSSGKESLDQKILSFFGPQAYLSILTNGRWFALVRPWTPWLAPRHGKSSFKVDDDALLCSFLSPQGKHMVFLGISGVDDVITLFRGGDSGRVMFRVRYLHP
jgi:hypothetical protein